MTTMTPDLAELRRLRDTEREELHSPTRRLDAYYYSFSETGSVPIDAILSAVAIAGKSCHNTDSWTEDDEWSRWGVGRSLVDVIQCAANEAAAALLDAAAERDALAAAVERVRALHQPEVNSTSALFPTPLCGCGDAHPCDTIRALDTTPETGGES